MDETVGWPQTHHVCPQGDMGLVGTFLKPPQKEPSFHLPRLGLLRDWETPSAFPTELKASCLTVLPKNNISVIFIREIKTKSLIICIQSEMLVSV